MKRFLLIPLVVSAVVLPARAGEQGQSSVLAVFDIDNRGPRLSKKTVENLSEYLSVLLTENGICVLDSEQMQTRYHEEKGKVPKKCKNEACRAELARSAGADQYLVTRILKIVDTCKVTAKVFGLEKGPARLAASSGEGCDEKELLEALKQIVFKLAYSQPEGDTEEATLYYYSSGRHAASLKKKIHKSYKTGAVRQQSEIGRLSVSSHPWGRIWIDGEDTGKTTPLVDYLLPIGKHEIVIQPPGDKKMTAEAEIWPGETTSLVIGSESGATGDKPYGWLSVNTRPWSEVSLDGKHIGMTPLRHQISPGKHEVKVTFAHGETQTRKVNVEPDKTVRVALSASGQKPAQIGKGMGLLMVNSLPWGRVWIDGRDCGKATPLFNYKLPAGKHRVTIYFSTGGLKSEEVEIKAGETTRKVFRSQ